MLTRRHFIATGAAFPLLPKLAEAQESSWRLANRYRPQVVEINPGFRPGDIHVDFGAHFIYHVQEGNTAMRYGVAVGRDGLRSPGTYTINRKVEWPSWTPTANMIAREPHVYARFAGGMAGGPDNPLGARALYLYRGGRDSMLRIHGTPQPWTIGTSVSSGCVRMVNDHVMDLYERVPIGTRVVLHRA